MIRRRYTVVIVGMRGMARSQRSEVSRHRSERDAFDAAATEVERLTTMHGERSAEYAVVVERDGVVVSDSAATETEVVPRFLHQADDRPPPPVEEHVRVVTRPQAPAPESDDDGTEHGEPRSAQAEIADVDERGPEPASTPAQDDDTDFEFFDEPPTVRRAAPEVSRAGDEDDDDDGDAPASGPVPDAVLRRFEEAIAREEQRRGRRPPAGGGPSRSADRPR
ncbi:MAG: hypothetical protein R2878_11775 [Thermoleophilia bacterium]